MKGRIVLLIVAVALLTTVHAQQKGPEGAKPPSVPANIESSWQGYIVDVKTGGEFLKHPESAMEKAAAYTKADAVKMQSSGFGMFSEGKWLKFDDAGNRKAQAVIKNTVAQKGILVLVTGMVKGDVVAVSSVNEYKKVETPLD